MNFTTMIDALVASATEALPTWNSLQNLTKQTLTDLAKAKESVTDFCDDLKASPHWPLKEDGTPESEKGARSSAAGLVLNRLKAAAAKYEVDGKGLIKVDEKGELETKKRTPSTPNADEKKEEKTDEEQATNTEIVDAIKQETVKVVMIAVREAFDKEMASVKPNEAKRLATFLSKLSVCIVDAVV